jgi:hypothetical protein
MNEPRGTWGIISGALRDIWKLGAGGIGSYWRWAVGRKSRWAKGLAIGGPSLALIIIVASGAPGGNSGKGGSETTTGRQTGSQSSSVVTLPPATIQPITQPAPPTAVPIAPTATPTAIHIALRSVTATTLLGVTDLPPGFAPNTIGALTNAPTNKSSFMADPSTYSACGPGPELVLDKGFNRPGQGVFPDLGETLMAYPSIDAANKAMNEAASRAQSCTKNDNVGSSTSITVAAQPVPDDLGDAVKGFKVVLAQKSGPPSIGYVIIVRRANVVLTIFYVNFTEDGDQVIKIARTAANKVN